MEIIFAVIIGIIIGSMKDNGTRKKVYEYFATPSDNSLELNWGLRQAFKLISKDMSERWYESRAHVYCGVLTSLLCAFGMIDIVRFEYGTDDDCKVVYEVAFYHGFRSYKDLIAQVKKDIPVYKEQAKDRGAEYFYQLFIAGHNVVMDFMNDY